MIFAFIILSTAILLSVVAAYYSIAGLTAIFAAAIVPVIIMGATLELGKVVATVWLHNNWKRISLAFKLYLVPAVIFLMVLTSMGIFGFLSKAHSDQSLVSGDAMSKVALYDEKISVEKENIAQAKKALEQMNAQVDQVLGRSDSERGAEKAVNIRKQQARERNELQTSILKSQKEIQRLQQERAPLAAEFRKVEAEVGPIKYIAALLYGDDPDQNILERAVRWVIILIVVVFDPLALCLILAGNKQVEWAKAAKINKPSSEFLSKDTSTTLPDNPEISEDLVKNDSSDEKENQEDTVLDYGECPKCATRLVNAPGIAIFCPNKDCDVFDGPDLYSNDLEQESDDFFVRAKLTAQAIDLMDEQQRATAANAEVEKIQTDEPELYYTDIVTEATEPNPIVETSEDIKEEVKDEPMFEGVKNENGDWVQTGPAFTEKKELPYIKSEGDYVEYQGKSMHIDVLRVMNPELFLQEDLDRASDTNFGTEFPANPKTGNIFVRVDTTPNKVFKYNGVRWIEVNRGITESYLTDEYLQFLVDKIATGEYDLDTLTENEQIAIEKYIQNQNT